MGQIFQRAESYVNQNQLTEGQWVEIGTSRNGDDGSTRVLSSWAKLYSANKTLTTVDIDPENCEHARNLGIDNVHVICSSGEDYLTSLARYNAKIALLYLDNFDWDWHPLNSEEFVLEQRRHYKKFGLDMTNVNSQRAHVAQVMLALPLMAECSVIICDDTWYNDGWGHFSGKSGSAIPLLMNAGYVVAETASHPTYGTIMIRGFK